MSKLIKGGNTALMAAIISSGIAPGILSGAYANDFTLLQGSLFDGLHTVSREMQGFIPAATRNSTVERAQVGQSVSYPIITVGEAENTTSSMTIPEPSDLGTETGLLAITNSKNISWGFTGEQQTGLRTGTGVSSVVSQAFAEALRKLSNEVEQTCADEVRYGVSRVVGDVGTVPYSNNSIRINALANKVLKENGSPLQNIAQIINLGTGVELLSNEKLTDVDRSGDTMNLRSGAIGRLGGSFISETTANLAHTSSATASVTAATGVSHGVGLTTIALNKTGLIRGDVISFANHPDKYMVTSATGTTVTISAPGLRASVAGDEVVTVYGDYDMNTSIAQNTLQLVTRAPATPQEGDAAVDRMFLADPFSGLVFEVIMYAGYKKVRYEVALAWGAHLANSKHTVGLFG